MAVNLELGLYEFAQWMREHSHKSGYAHLIYFYSDDSVEAKQLLSRLMYLDHETEWGWYDDYVEYCSARCFVPRARAFCGKLYGGAHVRIEPFNSSSERMSHFEKLSFVKLALFDVQELSEDNDGLEIVREVCQGLAERQGYVLLTGNGYPTEVFKNDPSMARLLLNGYVAKVTGNRIIFEGSKPVQEYDLPGYGLLDYGTSSEFDILGEFSADDCEELLFQWELLCTWKTRYGLFDFDLFKAAFTGAWRFFILKKSGQKKHQYQARLFTLLGGFVGGLFCWHFSLFTDDGPTGNGILFGNPFELAASEIFVLKLIRSILGGEFYAKDGKLNFKHPIMRNDIDFNASVWWERCVTLPEFRGAISELVLKLSER